jgi:prophage antirepressor-like protein
MTSRIQRDGNVLFFDFHAHKVRVVDIEGSPWFVAADACRALGLYMAAGAGKYVKALDPSERVEATRERYPYLFQGTSGGWRMTLISESGLYRLISRSDKPEAQAFQDWVFGEVLPSVRKTGGYALKGADRAKVGEGTTATIPLPTTLAEAFAETARAKQAEAEAWLQAAKHAAEREAAERAAAQAREELARVSHKADAFDALMASEGLLTTTEVALQLGFSSANRFNPVLHDDGVVRRIGEKWMPTAAYAESGLFKVVSVTKHGRVREQMKWTPKGLAWALSRYGSPGKAA